MKVFVSYTRSKDAFNAVTQFTEHFANELSQSDPESTVFMDKQNILPSDHFPEKIAQELNDSDVLLVLVSPAWFKSEWCRKEFELFARKKASMGQSRSILPVLWVETPKLKNPADDPIAKELADIQYADWRELRHKGWENPEVLSNIAKLAEKAVTKVPEVEREKADRQSTP